MNLDKLFFIHAIITLAAGIVLLVAPALIPGTVDINLDPKAYLLSYFLGAAEIALAYLSYYGRKLTDAKSLRLIALTFVVFHAATAAVELYAYTQGTSVKIWANIALRIIIIALFLYYGVRQPSK